MWFGNESSSDVISHPPQLDNQVPNLHDVALQLLLGGEGAEEHVRALRDLVGQMHLDDVQVVCQLHTCSGEGERECIASFVPCFCVMWPIGK